MFSVVLTRLFVFTIGMVFPLAFYLLYQGEIQNEYIYLLTTALYTLFLFVFSFQSYTQLFTVFNVFSIMYFGYVVGGVYYSFQSTNFGKFIGFMKIPAERVVELYELSLIFIFVAYCCFIAGYFLVTAKSVKQPKLPSLKLDSPTFNQKLYKTRFFVIVPLLLLGLQSWYKVAHATSGGIIESIIYFQAFRHMAEAAAVSTFLYNFYYVGIYYWLYLVLSNPELKVSKTFLLFSAVGMVMNLTQGQIMAPITFVLSQVVAVGLFRPQLQKKMLLTVGVVMSLAFLLYFLRIVSNFLFMGQEMNLQDATGDFMYKIVGSGNTADIQQISIIISTFGISDATLGATYFDWFRNTIGGFFGMVPSSVGLTLKELYFPSSSGAPTPGALGELIVNFYYLGPVLMFMVGAILGLFQSLFLTGKNTFYKFLYAIVLVKFVFLYPKVDSTMLSSLVYLLIPLLFFVVAHSVLVSRIKV